MMYEVKIFVTIKEAVIDPHGTAVKDSLLDQGFEGVESVRIGKVIDLKLNSSPERIEAEVKDMCEKLLVNQVIEEYRYEIEEVVSS